MTKNENIPTKAEADVLAQWAEAGEFDLNFAGGKTLHGAEAAAAGRALLESAGVDVDAVERAVGGRPRLDPSAPRGPRSPRVNVAIPETLSDALKATAKARGVRTSVLVREALARYLDAS
ncbi:MAG: CopG family transcriptional regulator [Dermatophilaceae bacterium]